MTAFFPSDFLLYLIGQKKVTWLSLVTSKSVKVKLAGHIVTLDKTVTLLGRKKREKLGSGYH